MGVGVGVGVSVGVSVGVGGGVIGDAKVRCPQRNGHDGVRWLEVRALGGSFV